MKSNTDTAGDKPLPLTDEQEQSLRRWAASEWTERSSKVDDMFEFTKDAVERLLATIDTDRERIAALERGKARLLAVLDDPCKVNTIDLRNELQPFLNEWLRKANKESLARGFAESYRYDSNDRWLLDHILIVAFSKIKAAAQAAFSAEEGK